MRYAVIRPRANADAVRPDDSMKLRMVNEPFVVPRILLVAISLLLNREKAIVREI